MSNYIGDVRLRIGRRHGKPDQFADEPSLLASGDEPP